MKFSHTKIQQIQALFEAENEIAFAYLFGSSATNKRTPLSDVDLAVYLKIDDPYQRFQKRCFLIGKLLHILNQEVDLVILNDVTDNYLLHSILTEGKIIFMRDRETYFDYYAKTIHFVLDFLTHTNYVQQRTNLANH